MSVRFGVAATTEELVSLAPLLNIRPDTACLRLASERDRQSECWRELLDEVDGLLVVGDPRRAPRATLPGILARDRGGRPVVLSWVPNLGVAALTRFASTAAEVSTRPAGIGPVALLSQWDRRALFVVRRTERFFERHGSVPFVRWSGERIHREALLDALGSGPGVALYAGHGRSIGWSGYASIGARHVRNLSGRPCGLVVSAACQTASRCLVALSFAEAWVTTGRAAASVGAVEATTHESNRHWVTRFCVALTEGAATVDRAVVAAFQDDPVANASHRLIGDPIAAMSGAADAWSKMQAVHAPGPPGGAVIERPALGGMRIGRFRPDVVEHAS